jgi:hypothetical protein
MDAQAREAARRRTLAQAAAFFAGGLAAPLVTLPLDVARTRLQGAARRGARRTQRRARVLRLRAAQPATASS